MSTAIKVNGNKLQWQDGGGGIRETQGAIIQTTTNFPAGSIKVDGTALVYKDQNNNIRSVPTSFVTSTNLPDYPAIKIVSSGALRILDVNGNHRQVQEGSAPTQVPNNVSVSAPATVFLYPYDAQVTWSNTNTTDQIIVRFFRNGSLVQQTTLGAGSTNLTSNSRYWSQGQEIRADVSYINSFGEGQAATDFMTA